ncbi:hypothetical protein OG453_37280 [Streptomyces sp. NBC_01381]|uniref:hypothetical protein n=1 Tax=Streptomyces sp. NBC_01381 TaxID=2903845 RepID=UPI002258E479|nr:hypothetical protein [Streptomyces sp. NBC_01381]MCX4672257.1 hypothetical protein [Streptomyces sp. NBC_01381]
MKRTTGRAVFTATQEIQLDPKEHNGNTSIKEGLWHTENTLRLDDASGSAKGLRASWKTACSGGACAADSAWSGSCRSAPRTASLVVRKAWPSGRR